MFFLSFFLFVLFADLTYFSVQTISPEVLRELLHVAGETPESVDLRVEDLQEPAAQVIHSLGITDLWVHNQGVHKTKESV